MSDSPDDASDGTLPSCWCGSTDYEHFLSGRWGRGGAAPMSFSVMRCANCTLLRTMPPPDERRYQRGESIWAEASLTDAWSERIARRVLDRAPGNRILDVGCSVGNVVDAAQTMGAIAEGIDLDPTAIARGQAAGRNIHQRPIEAQEGAWDGINLNHVLEHVSSLEDFLGHIARLLNPGGVLTIQVPYCRGVIPRLMGDHWFAWAPDEHVWHFEPKSLVRAVESLSPLRTAEVVRRGAIEPGSPGFKGAVKRGLATASSAVRRGDQLEAVFKRPA